MPESFLGEGLVYDERLPLRWELGVPSGAALARLNADNQQLLAAESTLDEARPSDAHKDESPALVHELQRLEYKLNILLKLTAELAARETPLPQPQRVRLASSGLEWFGGTAPAVGSAGLAHLYINPALPQPLRLPCTVAGERTDEGARVAQLRFCDLSEAVTSMLEKLIFRHHRRQIAGARLASPSPL
jgi:hypothetical protein